jgi:hypothetical protein
MFGQWIVRIHRYLGIALSPMFVVWFASGIGIMYARGMPGLTPQVRLQHLPPLDMARVGMTPAEALERGGFDTDPDQVVLLTIMDRPAYRFTGREPGTVFADTGERLLELGPAGALRIAARFMDLPQETLHYAGLLNEPDQWTISESDQMPLHKITVDDAAHTQLYVSSKIGEIVALTTRGGRALAWVAAIPHWLYFARLRLNAPLWTGVVLSISALGTILALAGLVLGIIQSRISYSGWMRWHYISGVLFGIFTFTWVFSGLLSMQPLDWASRGTTGDGIPRALRGGAVNLSDFRAIDAAAWMQALGGRSPKEIGFLRIQGDPYYLVSGVEDKPLLVRANSENLFRLDEPAPPEIRREPFSVESIVNLAEQATPNTPILESIFLSQYDSYYYANDGSRPLPVLRIKFGDADRTWFYIDPRMSQVLVRYTRLGRLERWIYHGFHSLDFSFWYYNRPLWQFAIITLSIGCIFSSGTGLVMGIKRVAQYFKRNAG